MVKKERIKSNTLFPNENMYIPKPVLAILAATLVLLTVHAVSPTASLWLAVALAVILFIAFSARIGLIALGLLQVGLVILDIIKRK